MWDMHHYTRKLFVEAAWEYWDTGWEVGDIEEEEEVVDRKFDEFWEAYGGVSRTT